MRKKVLKIGILSRGDYKKRTIAIARGEYKPKKDEPKVWFESINSMAQVLSNEFFRWKTVTGQNLKHPGLNQPFKFHMELNTL